jgi:hypothetical protein
VIGFLRFIGIVNASIWFGGTIALTFFIQPVFFTEQVKTLFPAPYYGTIAEIVIQRYFILQNGCAAIALIHFLIEWLYLGRALERFTLGLLVVIFSLGLVSSFWLQPTMHDLHLAKYRAASEEERKAAGKSFGMWHGISQSANIIVLPGLLFYLWRVTSANRTISFGKVSTGW